MSLSEFGSTTKGTALLCIKEIDLKEFIKKQIEEMYFHITLAESPGAALEKIKFNQYDLIIIEEDFDGPLNEDRFLKELRNMGSGERRKIFLVLLGDNWKTGDDLLAFTLSVNLLINKGSLGDMKEILNQSMDKNRMVYKVFNDLMNAMGRS